MILEKGVKEMEQQISEQEAAQWIEGLAAFDRDNETVILAIFAAFGVPKSYLDVGSGDGAMVNVAEKLGVEVNGLDQLPRPNHPKLLQVDLRKLTDLGSLYDLVTSIETAEHIEPEYANVFLDTITRHARHRVVFTAAMPGQQGHGHVNLHDAYYWREKFYRRGFDYNEPDTLRLASMLAHAHHASHHIEANLQVFTRRGVTL